MQTNPNPIPILRQCWKQLSRHADNPTPNLFIIPEERTISLIDGTPTSAIPAIASLDSWIEESLRTYGKVFLYTCGDNALISIEFPDPDWDMEEDEFGNIGPYEIQPDTPGLYIGFD